MSNALTTIPEITLTEMDGVPRAHDIEVAKRLGFGQPRDIRKLVARHRGALEEFGPLATQRGAYRGKEFDEYWLNEEQALLIATLSDAPNAPAVRAMLIRVFVAWRRGHLSVATLPPDVLEMIRRDDGISRMLSHKVTGIEATVQALATAVATIASAIKPPADGIYVTGRTAGEIWKAAGFPPIRITSWFSNRLSEMNCQIDGCRRAPVGTSRAKLFDQDKADGWLRNGGRKLVEEYVAKRTAKGQTVLRLVQPPAAPGQSAGPFSEPTARG